MSTTPKSGWRYPASSAAPNAPLDLQNLATDLDWAGANFATTSARNAANPTPTTGDMCRILGQAQVYYSSAWHYLQDDTNAVGPWVTLTPSTNMAATVTAQARQYGAWIEVRGLMRHSTYFGTGIVLLTDGGTNPLNNLSTAYSGGPQVAVAGMGPSLVPTGETVVLNPRTDGGIRITASAVSTVEFVALDGVRFPSA